MFVIINGDKPTYDSGIEYNGKRLIILPASKNMCERMKAQAGTKDGEDVVDAAYRTVAVILNNNTLGIKIPDEELGELDIVTVKGLISGYTSFINTVKNDPN